MNQISNGMIAKIYLTYLINFLQWEINQNPIKGY